METSVKLILDKLQELIVAAGGKVEAFYPYVLKQQIIEGYCSLIFFCLSFPIIACGIYLFTRKGNWEEYNPRPRGVFGLMVMVIGFVMFLGTTLVFDNVFKVFNPNYYAVKEILRLGSSLIGR